VPKGCGGALRKNQLRRQDGQTLLFVMLTVPLLLAIAALVVDGANLFVQKRAVQNTADAVAHALANDLDGGGTGCPMLAYNPVQNLNANITTTTQTSITSSGSNVIKAGDYIRIESEAMRVTKVVTTTLTVVRAQLGTSAALHNKTPTNPISKDLCATDANYYGSQNGESSTIHPCTLATDTNCYATPYGTPPDPSRIQVRISRNPSSLFADAAFKLFGGGKSAFHVAASAAATVGNASAPEITFAALNDGGPGCNENHSLIMRAGGILTVDSTIYVDSCNDHDGFDIKGGGGKITAPKIYTVGGWEFEGNVTPQPEVWVGGILCTLPATTGQHQFSPGEDGPGCPITDAPPTADPFTALPRPSVGAPGCGGTPVTTVTGKARNNDVATLTTSARHGLAVGDSVTVTGVDVSFNGIFTVTAVPSPTTFSYANPGDDVPPFISITAKERTGNVATLTTSIPHGFFAGDSVYIKGVGNPFSDGNYTVAAIPAPTTTTFSFTTSSSGAVAPVAANGNVGYSITFEQLTSNVATITTSSPHHLNVNDWVTVFDATKGAFNGTYQVTAVPTATTFRYARTNGDIANTAEPGAGAWGGPITGTVTSTDHGTAASPGACEISSGTVTLQPGTYYGGICIGTATNGVCDPCETTTAANAHVTFASGPPGTEANYIMAGGGLKVCGSSSLDAPNVMIYNTQDPSHPTGNGALDQIKVNTTGSVTLGPQTSGIHKGLTIFEDPSLSLAGGMTCGNKTGFTTTPSPAQVDSWDIALMSMASTGSDGVAPDGPLGSISGTVYSPGPHAEFAVAVSGIADLAVISDCILIDKSDSRFNFDSLHLLGLGTELTE
jgi:Flp pilus assembly protein TadG